MIAHRVRIFSGTWHVDALLYVLYNRYIMAVQNEARKLIALRIRPSIHRQARIAAVTEDRTLGRWLEEAIQEKIDRDRQPEDERER